MRRIVVWMHARPIWWILGGTRYMLVLWGWCGGMRLTVVGLGIIVAIAMSSHGWRAFGDSTRGGAEQLHAAAAVLVLAGALMGLGALMTIWNPSGTFIVPGLAAVLALIAGGNGIGSAFAYGAFALLLCVLTAIDANRQRAGSRR